MADANEIIVAPTAAPLTPMELLDRALSRGDDIAILEKLMDLQERHEKNRARKAFDAAVADAKARIPVIVKNREGHNNKKYADLGAFAAAVNPVLANFGLSYRYRSEQEGPAIRVTCVLSHRDGHAEETTLSGAADATGNKNGIQAIASTLTYLQRYTLKLALGLADAEGDDDGQAAGAGALISDEQLLELQTLVATTGTDTAKFCKYMRVPSLADIPATHFSNAVAALKKKAKPEPQKELA